MLNKNIFKPSLKISEALSGGMDDTSCILLTWTRKSKSNVRWRLKNSPSNINQLNWDNRWRPCQSSTPVRIHDIHFCRSLLQFLGRQPTWGRPQDTPSDTHSRGNAALEAHCTSLPERFPLMIPAKALHDLKLLDQSAVVSTLIN